MIYALLYAIVLLLSSVNASTVRLLRSPHRRSDDLWFQISRNATISKYSRDPSLNHAKRQQTGAGSLTNVGSDSAYYIQFSIGTPAKQYNILLDTGSSDLWLASTECNVGCSNLQTLYSAGNQVSSTYDASNGLPFGVQYIGGNITGYTAHETVSLVGFTVTDQLFGVVTSFTTASMVLPPAVTGLMGLAWQPLARLGTPWWQRAATATPWSQPLFAFSLSRSTGMQEATGGRFSIGELDQTAYTGDIDYVNIPSGHQSWWLIPLSSVAVGGTSFAVTGQLAAIDTATSFIGGPPDTLAQIYSTINGATRGTGSNEGYWVIPCDTAVGISFNFGSQIWSINPSDFVIQTQASDICVGAIFEVQFGQSTITPSWVIGDTFLKNVYSVFRYDPPSVGFASLSGTDNAVPAPTDTPLGASTSISPTMTSDASGLYTTVVTVVVATPNPSSTAPQTTQAIVDSTEFAGDQSSSEPQNTALSANNAAGTRCHAFVLGVTTIISLISGLNLIYPL